MGVRGGKAQEIVILLYYYTALSACDNLPESIERFFIILHPILPVDETLRELHVWKQHLQQKQDNLDQP